MAVSISLSRRIRLALFCVAVAWLGSGCASLEYRYGRPLPLDQVGSVEEGAHFARVLERFGAPSELTTLPTGMAFQYEYIKIEERQYGLILPGEIGKWIKAVYGSADAVVESMVFVFDEEGALVGAGSERRKADAGGGFSMTLVFSLGSLTDTADYENPTDPILAWGRGLVVPPFRALNRAQSLDTGMNGLQLTGTRPAVGQHALELVPE